jgi:MarR family 2-MHQ and catechol resistance regulon transcriptional repressor
MKSTHQYGEKTNLALSLWVKLSRASSTFHRLAARDIATYDLTEPQFAVLECLGHLGAMPIGTLCKKMLVSGGNMTVVVDNLEREGLVERYSDPNDGRCINVKLTPEGERYIKAIFINHANFITQSLSVLSITEQQELSSLLRKLGIGLRGG